MPTLLETIQEAEKRGLPIPDDKKQLIAEARKRGLVPTASGAAVPMLPEQTPMQKWGGMALRVGLPILGGALLGVPGAVGGGGLGETMAEWINRGTREQPYLNPAQIGFQAAINLVPFAKIPGVSQAAGKILSATGSRALSAVPVGAVAGAANVGGSALAEGQVPTLKELGAGAVVGGAFAGGVRYGIDKFKGTPEQHVQAATESVQQTSTQVVQAEARAASAKTPQEIKAADAAVKQADMLSDQTVDAMGEAANGEAPKPGMVRFYHGGVPGKGSRWVSPDLEYAQGYAKKSGGVVQYVDIPESHHLVQANRTADFSGTNTKPSYANFEAPEEIMRGAKLYHEANSGPGPSPKRTPSLTFKAQGVLAGAKDYASMYVWQPMVATMKRRGGAAADIGNRMEAADTEGRTVAGQTFTPVEKTARPLGDASTPAHTRVRRALKGELSVADLKSPEEEAAYKAVRQATGVINGAGRQLGIEAEESGGRPSLYTYNPRTGERAPYRGMSVSYFPLMLKMDARQAGTPLYNKIIDYIGKSMGVSREKAVGLWQNALFTDVAPEGIAASHNANLETGRTGLYLPDELGAYEDNITDVMARYLPRASRRIAQVKNLGKDSEEITRKLAVLESEDRDLYTFASRAFDRYMGKDIDKTPTLTKIVEAGMDITSLSYLSPRSTLKHAAQAAGGAIRTGDLPATWRALRGLNGPLGEEYKLAGHALREATQNAWEAAKTGSQVAAERAEQEVAERGRFSTALSRTSQRYVKAVGLKAMYDFNRQLSFATGWVHADRMAEKFALTGNKYAARELERMNLDPRQVAALRERWTNIQKASEHPDYFTDPQRTSDFHQAKEAYHYHLREGGTTVMRDAGLENDVLHSPLLYSDRKGRFFLQFKIAALKQTKFLWDNVVKETAKGNLRPLAILGATGLTAGEVIADARELSLGRSPMTGQALFGDERKNPVARGGIFARSLGGVARPRDILNNYTGMGLAGYAGDVLEQAMSGREYASGFFGSPVVEHIYELGGSIWQSLQQESFGPAAKQWGKFGIPILSPTLGMPAANQFSTPPGRKPGGGSLLGGRGGGLLPSSNRKTGWIGR